MLNQIVTVQGAKTIEHIQPVSHDQANGRIADIYAQIKRDDLLNPPLMLHSPAPDVLAGVWAIYRETLATGIVPRPYKEAVAAVVSSLNACPYCVDAHTMMLHGTNAHSAASAIGKGRFDDIRDPKMRALVEWAQATRSPDAAILQAPPFSAEEAPEIIGVAVGFHYINRMVHIFLNDSPLPVNLGPAQGMMKRMAGGMMKHLRRPPQPGDSLTFLPQADLPDDLGWTASNPNVAAAFAGLALVVEEAGRVSLPEAVRTLVRERIAAWNKEEMGLSRRWVEDAIAGLNEADKPAGRLALLTAFASYQVDDDTIKTFCTQQPGDDKLVGATAWASFTAARQVGSWLSEKKNEIKTKMKFRGQESGVRN